MTVLRDWQAASPRVKTENGWQESLVWTVDGVATKDAAYAAVNTYVINTEGVTGGIAIKAAHPDTNYLQVVSTSTTELAPSNYYSVEVTYQTPTFNGTTGANPFQSPPVYEWAQITRTVQVEEDVTGNPIVNSAGDPFDQPPSITDRYWQLTVTRNEPYFNLTTSVTYQNKVNSDTVYLQGVGAGKLTAGQMFCVSILPVGPIDLTDNFVSIAYTFWIRESGFQLRRLDLGYRQHLDSEDKSKPITDENGDDITVPVLLDGSGAPYDETVVGVGTPAGATLDDTGTGVFLTYNVYDSVNFGDLRLFGNEIG